MRLTDAEKTILLYVRKHYPIWVSEIETASDSRAICYDGIKVQSSNDYDSTYELAIKTSTLRERVIWVEQCLVRVFVTEERVKKMRRVFCYNELDVIDKHEYYEVRQIFADALIAGLEADGD